MKRTTLLAMSLGLAACSSGGAGPIPPVPAPARAVAVDTPRKLKGVPPGHYPPPGHCRLWYDGRPPGHQPPPTRCESLIGLVPRGAFVLYNDAAWDSEYDWHRHEKAHRGSVPEIILGLLPHREGR